MHRRGFGTVSLMFSASICSTSSSQLSHDDTAFTRSEPKLVRPQMGATASAMPPAADAVQLVLRFLGASAVSKLQARRIQSVCFNLAACTSSCDPAPQPDPDSNPISSAYLHCNCRLMPAPPVEHLLHGAVRDSCSARCPLTRASDPSLDPTAALRRDHSLINGSNAMVHDSVVVPSHDVILTLASAMMCPTARWP